MKEKQELKNIFKELKNGNKDVIEKLYNQYNRTVYGIAFSILKNKEDSEDIVQTVFAKLYTIDKEKMPQEKEATWLYTVTKNETLLFLRKKSDTCDLDKIYDIEDKNNDIEQLIDRENYNHLISNLNDKQKEIVSLKTISNLSFSQIAELLGEKTGTVKWRYYQAVYRLKTILSNLAMFIVTFMVGIFTFNKTNKIIDKEMQQNAGENIVQDKVEDEEDIKESVRDEISSKGEMADTENTVIENQTQEDIIVEEPIVEETINYLGYGMLSVSSIFLIATIIFAIFLKKCQLKSTKKSSK